MTNQGRFPIAHLLEGKSAIVQITPGEADGGSPGIAASGLQVSKGLGLELENIAALPDAEDYALHDFYRANFTQSEIAYCINQPAAKAAFQGLFAAKRAIVTSGAAGDSPEGLRSVEIGFGDDGRPSYPGCLLAIGNTGTIAVAVCFWLGGLSWPAPPASGAARPPPRTFPVKTRILAFLVLLSLLLLFALGLREIFELWRH